MLKILRLNLSYVLTNKYTCLKSCSTLFNSKKIQNNKLPSKKKTTNLDKDGPLITKASPPSKYKHTIFLPSTKFPNFIKDVPKYELELQKVFYIK